MISKQPWSLKKNEDGDYWLADADNNWICDAFFDEDSQHIVKCVNEYDNLVAEIEHLKKENEQLIIAKAN